VASTAPRVLVAGGGIVGAAIAFALARRGAAVVVAERAVPGAGATGASFAWANAGLAKEPRHYFDLHRHALGDWQRLLRDLGGRLDARFAGTVEWQPPGAAADELRRALRRHQAWGSPAHELDGEALARLLPHVVTGPVGVAVLAPDEGAPDPVAAAESLLAAATAHGADVRRGCAVLAAEERAGGLRVVTDAGDVGCDRLVLACGIDTPALAAAFGLAVPLVVSAGTNVHTAPLPPLVEPVVLAPGAHVLQRADGTVVTGRDFGGGDATASADELLAAAAGVLPALADAPIARLTRGMRVLTADGFPAVGPAPGGRVHVAVTHSGVSLAPLLGRLVAAEILDEVESDLLGPYRPGRFGRA
jgi:glycine/D-amino acid oxidase-like deaminating enzyme